MQNIWHKIKKTACTEDGLTQTGKLYIIGVTIAVLEFTIALTLLITGVRASVLKEWNETVDSGLSSLPEISAHPNDHELMLDRAESLINLSEWAKMGPVTDESGSSDTSEYAKYLSIGYAFDNTMDAIEQMYDTMYQKAKAVKDPENRYKALSDILYMINDDAARLETNIFDSAHSLGQFRDMITESMDQAKGEMVSNG